MFRKGEIEIGEGLDDRLVLAHKYRFEKGLSVDLPIPDTRMRVSVVIPAFNEEEKILRTLRGLNSQTSNEFEVIFVDNGSSDKTMEIIREYALREAKFPLYLVTEVKKGPGNARRRGMDQAAIRQMAGAGVEYIAGSDADSVPEKDWIAGIIASFKSSNADLLVGDIQYYCEIEGTKFWPLKYLDKVREVTSRHIKPRLRGINFAIRADTYMAIGGVRQPCNAEGKPMPGEEGSLTSGVVKLGGSIRHMDTMVMGDPRRFLDNLAQGKGASISLYGPPQTAVMTDIRDLDVQSLLERVTDQDVIDFAERQMKNIFKKDVLGTYLDETERGMYWKTAKLLLGEENGAFERDVQEDQIDLDYLWDKYGAVFLTSVGQLLRSE